MNKQELKWKFLKLQREAEIKKMLMEQEFQYNLQLAQARSSNR